MRKSSSRWLTILIVIGDIVLTAATLCITVYAILRNYVGTLPYLTALIGMYNAATAYMVGEYFKKSKAENTAGGIVFETAMMGVKRDA